VKQTLLEIEQNIKSRKETDKIMWFSMWAVLSVASFGVAWFPMIYYLIKRRNTHFARQQKLETLILNKLGKTSDTEKQQSTSSQTAVQSSSRNPTTWTLLTLLILPAFYVFYFLINDLRKHEEHEHDFLVEVTELAKDSGVPLEVHGFSTTPNLSLGKYVGLSVVTCGLMGAYWLYRIFNDYNSHFKMQWQNEDALLSFLEALDKKSD
jgi:preprotein translocase subunit YajC